MTKQFQRSDRVAELIKRELAILINREIKDPRLSTFVTVTAVKVSKDLSFAKVYITILEEDDAEKVSATLALLNQAVGHIRRLLGRQIKLRLTPELQFVYDESLRYGNRMTALVKDALKKDGHSES